MPLPYGAPSRLPGSGQEPVAVLNANRIGIAAA